MADFNCPASNYRRRLSPDELDFSVEPQAPTFTPEDLAQLNAWHEDEAREQAKEEERCRAVEARNAQWTETWPNHCRQCGGWGATGTGSTWADPGDSSDPCDALPETTCHRCGEDGLDEDGNGPCTRCGWNFDDGLQEF
jgi:hypothetical protein